MKELTETCYLRKTILQYHGHAPENWENVLKKIAIFLEDMAADGNVNNLVNTTIHHSAFRKTINANFSGNNTHPSCSVSPAQVQTDKKSLNVSSPIGNSMRAYIWHCYITCKKKSKIGKHFWNLWICWKKLILFSKNSKSWGNCYYQLPFGYSS